MKTAAVARKLGFVSGLLLCAAGVFAFAAPGVFGQGNALQSAAGPQTASAPAVTPAPVYETASIKPDKSGAGMSGIRLLPGSTFSATNVTVESLIHLAYRVEDNQISGAPSWVNSDRYDVEAKPDDTVAEELQKLPPDQRLAASQSMLQALLADRFKLAIHRETKDLPIYALVIAKNGPKLQEAKPGDTYANGIKGPGGTPGGAGIMQMAPGRVTGQAIPLANLVRLLSGQLGRTVVDKTGLTGKYDITLQWTPDASQGSMMGGAGAGQQGPVASPPPDSSGPSIFTAIQEQLGLKLESQTGPVELIVIDHVEPPSEN